MLALDIDGVIGDFALYTTEEVNRELGTNFSAEWETNVEKHFAHEGFAPIWDRILKSEDTWEAIRPYEGVMDRIKNLQKYFTVIAITRLEVPKQARIREAWFKRLGVDIKVYAVKSTDEKVHVAKRHGVKIMVEDTPKTAKQMADAGIISFLMDQPWNRSETPEGVIRVFGWDNLIREHLRVGYIRILEII